MITEDLSRYNGENTVLRKAQLRMLDILIEVDKICRRHNITYWLDGGTCLGAVRHGGFIPWDDDLDIGLMRRDYKRLCKILKTELPDNLVFQDETTDKNYPLKFAKVRDKNSCFEDNGLKNRLKENGIYIDIFPIERGTLKVKIFVDFFYGRAFRRLRHQLGGRKEYLIACFMYPFAYIMVLTARISGRFIKSNLIYAYGVPNVGKYQLNKSFFVPTKPVKFENREFPAPANPEAYLRELYGDYMQIPPEDKRAVHANKIEIYE
jgi:lipopolysaccharide cholinephosphotransferase